MGGFFAEAVGVPAGAMDPRDTSMMPKSEMQNRHLAEPDQWFWIGAHSSEVQTIGNTISALPTACSDDCPYLGITERFV
ncbi:hypothetical protein TSH100_15345 [Azospirillum sp. TSH100]|nr:hypothetical protein TSH100_15345 [Azospirillum sp. TSH100]